MELAEEKEIIEALELCLDYEDVAFDQHKVDKNYDILCYLRDYKLPDNGKKLSHFLNDHDERIRFSTTEVLLEQENEEIYQELEKFLADESSENIRIRQAITEKFAEISYTVSDKKILKPGTVINGYLFTKKMRFVEQQ